MLFFSPKKIIFSWSVKLNDIIGCLTKFVNKLSYFGIVVVFSSLCYKTDGQSVSMKRNASVLPLWKGGSLPISWARSHSMIKILRFSTTKIFVLNSIGSCTNIWTWAWAKYGVIIDRLRPTVLSNQICLVSRNIRNRYLVSAGICDLGDQIWL